MLATGDALDLDAEAVQRTLHIHGSRDHANGARESLGLGENAVGTHGNVVPTRGRNVRHARDYGLVRPGLGHRTPDRIARHARAPGAVDTQDNGFH